MGSCLDAELWKVCAGNMVKVPLVNSKVMYFPQGHAEQANGIVDFSNHPEIPARVECRVVAVKYMVTVENDEVYLRMRLLPMRKDENYVEFTEDDLVGHLGQDGVEKCSSFTKTLTQSDANNGGGFSVPRYCADSIFPILDYSADPPMQNLHIKDVHGVFWKFRHIFRGKPKRHLLTTGWSNFVNDKKLVAGDSVIFLRARNGELCIGFRRAKRGISRVKSKGGIWELPHGGYNSFFDNGSKGGQISIGRPRKIEKVSAETVLETGRLAAAGKEFEVDYYPRAGVPEFCVKPSVVSAALRIQWCAGMKFKTAFETEDASKVTWFVGTIQSVQAADPVRWPTSPWRMLQVTWDKPNLTHNVERVSPWMVDIEVSGMLNMHPVSFSPTMKRLRLVQPPELSSSIPHPPPSFPDPFIRNLSYYPTADNAHTCIQGARHVQFGQYPLNLHIKNNTPHPRLFPEFRQPFTAPLPAPVGLNFRNHQRNKEDPSRLLTLGNTSATPKKDEEATYTAIVLFGQRIVMEEKKSEGSSNATLVSNSNILSDGDMDEVKNGTECYESESVQNCKECSSDSRSSAEIKTDPQILGAWCN